MTKPVSFIGILRSWVQEELPTFWVDPLPYSCEPWLGFIRCMCTKSCPAAIARVEVDRICFIRPRLKRRPDSHFDTCTKPMKMPWMERHACYCGERIIMIFKVNFASLKKRLVNHHERMKKVK